MAKPIIDASKFMKNLEAMVDTLPDRAEAFQRLVTHAVTEGVQEELMDRAPTSDPDLPDDYRRELQVVKVEGRDASYAVVYRGKPKIISHYDPEKTVLYIHLLKATDDSPTAALFGALARFQPFTMDTMPLDVPRDTAFVVAKVVTKAETDVIRKRLVRMKGLIQRVVTTKGKGIASKAAFDRNSALIFNDMAFQVLRKELGIGLSKKPHWRPALKFVASDPGFIKKLMMSDESVRLWNDPTYSGWKKAGMIQDVVGESSVNDLDDFQKKIVPKGGLA